VLPIVPQLAAHVAAALAVNCRVPFTANVGFCGDRVNPDVPVPESATDCGLPLAESANRRIALRAPAVVGAKMMFALQLADGAREVPQVLLKIRKSPGFVPAKAMLLIVIEVVALFFRVTVFCAPLPPTGTETQLRLDGVTDALPEEVVPVPASATD
jgi:hypothetical protein